MALAETLHRADGDVRRGDLGKARDRLEGLLKSYPDELEIRRRLGDVYWRLQYPDRAGMHWYLLPSASPEMDEAKSAFEARHGGDPWRMLDAIRYRGGMEAIAGTSAESTLRDLARRAGVSTSALESATRRREAGERSETAESWRDKLVVAIVLGVLASILVLSCIGAWTVVRLLPWF